MPAHAEINKSRSKKNPFKVTYIGENSEPVANSELLTTKNNCKKNIRAMVGLVEPRVPTDTKMRVHDFTDKTEKPCRMFYIHADGLEEEVS